MIIDQQIRDITEVIRAHAAVKLAYLFGSQVSGDVGPLSDYDIAVYVDGLNNEESIDLRLGLAAELSKVLKTDKIDLVMLNQTDNPALKYSIISSGRLLVERSPYKLLIEPKILNEYFDLQSHHQRHKLTKVGT